MPSQINFNPLRAVGSDGIGSAGALANFFETGTTTPITVFTDSSLSTPHDTPLVADAQGVFPSVFTSGATGVKVSVTTALGGAINGYPMDPVQLIPSTGSAASAVSFAPVTGNSSTDVQAAVETLTTAKNTSLDIGGTSPFASAAQGGKADAALPASSVLDEADFAQNSTTKPPSQASVKGALDAKPINLYFESTGNAIPAVGTATTVSHGLAGRPTFYTVTMICTTADSGYAVGDEINLSAHEGNGTRALGTWCSNSGIGFVYSSGIYISGRPTGVVVAINTANWTLTYRAWR